jgi:hypothetical protein
MRHCVKVDRRARSMLAGAPPPEVPRPGGRPSIAAAVAETRSPTAAQAASIKRTDSAVRCHAAR